MSKKVNGSSSEGITFLKAQTWVFDERMGWVDVKEYLVKIRKLGEALTVNLNKHSKENLVISI